MRLVGIYLNHLASHHYSFTAGEIDTLYDIAIQCPLAGSKAVYYARNLYRLIADTLFYNDLDACGEAEERIGQINTIKNDIVINPNPTSDYFDMVIRQGNQASFDFVLFDDAGRVCDRKSHLIGNHTRINTSILTEGIYYLKVTYEDKKTVNKKVVVIR